MTEASAGEAVRPARPRLPGRARAAVALIIVFALVSDAQSLVKALVDYVETRRPTAIEVYLTRFVEIRTALPARGVVGYLAEPKGKEILHGGDYYRKFHLAQYALAPVIIVDSPDRPLVIGNFASGTPPPAAPGLSLVRDYGNGVMLFKRRGE